MTTDWNPNADNVLGLEWVPSEIGHRIINGSSKAAGMNFTSTEAEIIDRIWLGLPLSQQSLPLSGGWLVEVFTAGAEIPGPVTTFTARPNGTSKNNGNYWKDETGANVAIGAGVGDAIGDVSLDVSDYVQYTGTYQAKRPLVLELATASFPSGKRTVGGRIVFVANREDATGKLQVHLHRELEDDNYGIGEITVDAEIREFSVPFPEICPWTGVGWTDDQIHDFDIHNPGVDGFTVRLKPIGIGKHKPLRIYQMYAEIDYVTENRVGAAVADFILAEKDWVPFDFLYGGDGGLRWDKLDSTDYTITLRRTPKWKPLTGGADLNGSVTEGGAIGWRYLAEQAPVVRLIDRDPWLPDSTMESYAPVLNSDGTIASLGEPGVRGYSFYLDRYSSLVDPVDGQPYLYFFVNDTADGDTIQYLITDSGGTYGLVRLVVGPRADAVDPITISVHLTDDDSQIGSSIELTVEEALAGIEVVIPDANVDIGNPGGVTHYLVEAAFDTPPTLAGGAVSYYVKVAGPTGEDTCWEVLLLSTNTVGLLKPCMSTFGGQDEAANDASLGIGAAVIYDSLIQLVVQPDPVFSFDAEIDTQTLITDEQCDTATWLIHDLEFASLTWSPTDLEDDFVNYEIQRTQDEGVTWETIFSITDETVNEAHDYEARRNVVATYRIRVMSSWHAPSDWSSEADVTCAMDDCALLFVSNEAPELNQGYVDIGGSRSWKFLTADEKETHILVGRDYQVVTGPLEYRGDQFEADVVVWAGSIPVDTGRTQFDLIESLNTTAVSYVCMLDETGRRWLADVAVTDGDRQGSKTHIAKVKVIELTDTPSLVDIDAP